MATDNDDYEILPHKELFDLKKQVEELKGGPSSKKLMESMDDLKHTVNELIELFKATSQELKTEEKEEATIHKKLDKLSSQQKVIAEAILSLSEKVGSNASGSSMKEQQDPAPLQQFQPQPAPFPSSPPAFSPQPQFGNPQAPPEPFTPRPFSLGQEYSQRPMPPQNPLPGQFNQGGFGDFNQNQFNSPYQNTPGIAPPQGAPPSGDDMPDFDDLLGDKKKKKGLFGVFKK